MLEIRGFSDPVSGDWEPLPPSPPDNHPILPVHFISKVRSGSNQRIIRSYWVSQERWGSVGIHFQLLRCHCFNE